MNTAKSNTFVWNYDNEPVLITMTERNDISTNSTTNDDYLVFDVSCSKTIDYYDNDKIFIENGKTFSFEISGEIVSFKVNPNKSGLQTSLHLLPGFIISTLGTTNATQTDTFYWTYDGEAPIITFSSTTQGVVNGSVTSIQDISMAIEISEVPLVLDNPMLLLQMVLLVISPVLELIIHLILVLQAKVKQEFIYQKITLLQMQQIM